MTDARCQGEALSLVEEQAYQLSRVAIAMDQARATGGLGSPGLTSALQENLMVWIAIRTMVQRIDCSLSPETKRNLVDLGNFMADRTFDPQGLQDKTLDLIININLQICEGLLEGEKRARGG